MKIIILVFFVPLCLASQSLDTLYKSSTTKASDIKCILLDSIISNKDVQMFLDIYDTKNYRACVRVVNASNLHFECNFQFRNKNQIPITCFVSNKIDFSLNVGYYRDMIIDSIFDGQNEVVFSVYVPHFKKQYSMEHLPHMVFTFSVVNHSVRLINVLRDYVRAPVGNF